MVLPEPGRLYALRMGFANTRMTYAQEKQWLRSTHFARCASTITSSRRTAPPASDGRCSTSAVGRGNASYRYAGRLDEAMVQFRTALSLSPGYIGGHQAVGEVLLQKGDANAALAEMLLEADEANRLTGVSMAQYALGHNPDSDAALADLIQMYGKTAAYSIATALAYRGEADRAYQWLDRAAQFRESAFGSVALYPALANIHPRWLPFLRKHGMAPEQLAAIKFDVKVPK
jgi:tetratricopeptide (TPR) repeat protein